MESQQEVWEERTDEDEKKDDISGSFTTGPQAA